MQNIPVSSTRFLRDFCFEIFGCARQYEQALLHSLAREFPRQLATIKMNQIWTNKYRKSIKNNY